MVWWLIGQLLLMGTAGADRDAALRTVAERSGYRATARYDQVVAFIDALKYKSTLVHRDSLGRSVEGRDIPMLVLADPPVRSPAEARAAGKLVVLAFGNIHAGEVCGKEALLMLAREVIGTPQHPLLQNLVILLVPILNTDGNERVARDNRPGQVGPADGMGQRANAQQLDLNRDYVKLESPEIRALVRLKNEWDPAVTIDTHTTNGSHHQYLITYAGPRHPAGDHDVVRFVRERMLPEVSRRMLDAAGYKSFFYGNFNRERTRWETYPALPRFGTPYRGLRNRISILSEAYAYAPYRRRVEGTLEFVRQILEFTADHAGAIRTLLDEADRRTTRRGRSGMSDEVPIRTALAPFEQPVRIEGYVEREVDGKRIAGDEPQQYEVQYFGRFESTLSVRRPYGYAIPAEFAAVLDKLRQHGVRVDTLDQAVDLTLEVYRAERVRRAEQPFQNHHLLEVAVQARTERRRLPAGTCVVSTAQPLGTLAVVLLEPHAEDGLCTWGFLDGSFEAGEDIPIYRIVQPLPEEGFRGKGKG